MEFVNGRPLLDFARDLPMRGKLELFARVCDAVHHAHVKGVIHRDLKPSNILVEGEASGTGHGALGGNTRFGSPVPSAQSQVPTPKILDFGVARLTDSDIAAATMQTDVGRVIGTIPYMSPEQIRGETDRLDTRSDVYALGVILYEVLVGRLPYTVKGKAITEAARIITEDEPTNPGSISRGLRGEVATIVLKALAKEPERRYASAADLGEDIRRFLGDQPIAARPATTSYQLRKFAQRNKILVAGVIGVVLALVVGVVGTSVGMVRARRAETTAARNAEEARVEAKRAKRTLEFVRRVLMASDPRNTGGKDLSMRELLAELAARAQSELGDDPQVAAVIYDTIASSYLAISDEEKAAQFAGLSEKTRIEHFGKESAEYAQSLLMRGRLERAKGHYVEATALTQQGLDLLESKDGENRAELALAMGHLAEVRRSASDAAGAEPLIRRAIELLGDDPANTVSRLDMMTILGDVLWLKGDPKQSEAIIRETLRQSLVFYGEDHPDVAFTKTALARALQHGGKADEAVGLLREAHAIFQRVYPPGHQYRSLAAGSLVYALLSVKQLDEADRLGREELARLEAENPRNEVELLRMIAMCALVANGKKDYAAEEVLRRRHVEISRRVHGPDFIATRQGVHGLAQCLLDMKKFDEAGEILRPLLDPALDATPDFARIDGLLLIARWLDETGDAKQAEAAYQRATRVAADSRVTPSSRLHAVRRYSGWLERRHRMEDAEVELIGIQQALSSKLGEENLYARNATKELAAFRQRRADSGKAAGDKPSGDR
jgi:tetratricopeptide (TPR) repeat protein